MERPVYRGGRASTLLPDGKEGPFVLVVDTANRDRPSAAPGSLAAATSYSGSMPQIASLQCSRCQRHTPADRPQTVCPHCAGVLYVRYDMDALRATARKPTLAADADGYARQLFDSMWRYQDVLPAAEPVTLGEGWTPMLASRRYPGVWLKEEATNPTGTSRRGGCRWP